LAHVVTRLNCRLCSDLLLLLCALKLLGLVKVLGRLIGLVPYSEGAGVKVGKRLAVNIIEVNFVLLLHFYLFTSYLFLIIPVKLSLLI
jgi:hypothetical protein